MSLWSQNAHPSVIHPKISILSVGVGAYDDPISFWLRIKLPSVAQKHDLQKPSLVREGGPLAVDE